MIRLLSIDLTNAADNRRFLRAGWSVPESQGCWAIEKESWVDMPQLPAARHYALRLKLAPYLVPPAVISQRLSIEIDGTRVLSEELNGWREIDLSLPFTAIKPGEAWRLRLDHPDAMSPHSLGISQDGRPLGFLVQQMEIWAEELLKTPEDDAALLRGPSAHCRPVVHVVRQGRLGNQMFQYLVARAIQDHVPDCALSGIDLGPWGILHEMPAQPDAVVHQVNDPQRVDIGTIVNGFKAGRIERVEYAGYGQRLENLPSHDICQAAFQHDSDVDGFGSDTLLINIRGEEVVKGIHDHYTLVPISFYQQIIAETGLIPVFMGQLDSNPYTDRLRNAFPKARFIPSRGIIEDFETIRRSKRIVVAVSTFSWLAAWLSDADQIILPVMGLYNPMQVPDVDLLPLDDARYRFFLFPVSFSAVAGGFESAHVAMQGLWREVSPRMLEAIRAGRPRYARQLADYMEVFDRNYYMGEHPIVAEGIRNGAFSSPDEHYRRHGFERNLVAFLIDRRWYASQYPLAAFEVAQGDFMDLEHHFAAIGRLRGYMPVPWGMDGQVIDLSSGGPP